MSVPTSLNAYSDCRDLFDRAVEDGKGARACLGHESAAIQFRTRMHVFRRLDRDQNKLIYPEGHEMHGQTIYDEYIVQIREDEDGEHWVYVTKRAAKLLAVEGLSEMEGE